MFSINVEKGKEILKAKVAANAQEALGAMVADYPAEERLTFSKQEEEARKYLTDNAAATPLLSGIAAARGVSVADLAGLVVAKADALTAASGAVLGKRHKLEQEVNAITDASVLLAVDTSI